MEENKNILVLGANGMLGHVVATYLDERSYNVDNITNSGKLNEKSVQMDLTNKREFEKWLSEHSYDVIVNAVGILTKASSDRPDLATYLNSYLPHQLEEKFRNTGTKIIHCSTDCVFSGEHGPYKEDAEYDGQLFYDRSKALGEIINDKDLTFRQSIIGPDMNKQGVGLFNWFMGQTGTINGYTKAIWNGITALELAKGIDDAIQQDLAGLYHLVPNGNINKYDLLNLFNTTFNWGLTILPESKSMDSDKTLINTRTDFRHEVPDYPAQIADIKEWIDSHDTLYPQYRERERE